MTSTVSAYDLLDRIQTVYEQLSTLKDFPHGRCRDASTALERLGFDAMWGEIVDQGMKAPHFFVRDVEGNYIDLTLHQFGHITQKVEVGVNIISPEDSLRSLYSNVMTAKDREKQLARVQQNPIDLEDYFSGEIKSHWFRKD